MDLSNVVMTKIGKDGQLYMMLKAASEDTQFTRADDIIVSFEVPDLKELNGPNRKEEGRANAERIHAATANAQQALKAIEGLTIEHVFGVLGSAVVSGSAKAIVAMLELPEVKLAESMKGVTLVASSKSR